MRASEAPHLCVDRTSEKSSEVQISSASWFAGRMEAARFPGCLTSESEERETWTAESLRTAPRGRRLRLFFEESGHGRDFGGRRFRSSLTVRFGEQSSEWADSGTSSKRVISRNHTH